MSLSYIDGYKGILLERRIRASDCFCDLTNSIELNTTREAPPVVRPLDSFPAFYGTRRFNTEFTRALHLSLSWTRPIQSTSPHPTSTRSILILSNHLRLGLPSGFRGLVVRIPSYRSRGPLRFSALPDFLSSGSGTGSTQLRSCLKEILATQT
jgi:hypothetical protein